VITLRAPRHRSDSTGGAEGNEKLTAMTEAMLLVLLAAEGFTLLGLHRMLTLHFVRYYTGAPAYVKKGPPAILLRLLGPVVMGTSIGVIGSGVALAFTGPGPSLWMFAHKAFFAAWFGD